ncbi:MAG TPA: CzcE family metal-binding protein [Herbaspirillum sp.]|jgi:hypothetical protein
MSSKFVLTAAMLLVASLAVASPRIELLGTPAPSAAAVRTVVIADNTKYVNVKSGEVVRFMVNGTAFTWNFNGPQDISSGHLSRVAPDGFLNHNVNVYVAPSPWYSDVGI